MPARALWTFGRLSDIHVVDEESPARGGVPRRGRPPFTSAYRPHGTVSLWGTLLDHDAPADPGAGAGGGPRRLASISRELSYNDPDADNGEDGHGDARGGEGDRNVELVVRDPR